MDIHTDAARELTTDQLAEAYGQHGAVRDVVLTDQVATVIFDDATQITLAADWVVNHMSPSHGADLGQLLKRGPTAAAMHPITGPIKTVGQTHPPRSVFVGTPDTVHAGQERPDEDVTDYYDDGG